LSESKKKTKAASEVPDSSQLNIPFSIFDLSHASFVKSTSSLLRQLSITPVTQPDGAGHYASARGTC
jgi:hypothetical protein